VNGSGEFTCVQGGAGSVGSTGWACSKLPKSAPSAQKSLLAFYTPAHWVSFLQAFSLAAGFAGDKITSSSTTVHGFPMQCVDFTATGVQGTSKICTTAQHLLGLVNVAGQSTSFQITSYSSSPSPALFRLPPGAKITNQTAGG
jgi:hypothetical protein